MYSMPTDSACRASESHFAIAGRVAPINIVGGVSTITQTSARHTMASGPCPATVKYAA